jgi:thiamine transport system permease protein
LQKLVSRLVVTLIIFFLISPFLILVSHMNERAMPDWNEVRWATQNSIIQAFFSTLIAAIIGILLFRGLFYLKKFNLKSGVFNLVEFLCLMPSFLPALFTILIFLSAVQPFPMGILGVSIVHGFMYAGVVAITFVHLTQYKARGLLEVSYLMGAGFRKTAIELFKMMKWDFLSVLILVFSVCFTSFSVPVALGGGKGTTLEILIYEKMKITGDWSQALVLAFIQMAIVALFSLLIMGNKGVQPSPIRKTPLLGSRSAFLCLLGYICFFLGGFVIFSLRGWDQVFETQGLWTEVKDVLPQTIFLGVGSGLFMMMALLSIGLGGTSAFLRRFLLAYVGPSVSLIGFAVIFLHPEARGAEVFYFILGNVILSVAALYKMGFEQVLSGLRGQIEVARLMGSGDVTTFSKIIFPQVLQTAFRLSGIAVFWAIGDFALCKVIFTNDFLLAQIVDDLMSSYRIEAATALMSLMIAVGGGLSLVFVGMGNVFSNEPY